ncbi:hypothetical protein EMIT0194P_10201 [Pseudomonas serbica]
MVIGDLGQGIEAVDGRDDLTTHVLEQCFGGATNRLRVVDHHDLQGAGLLFHSGSTVAFKNLFVHLRAIEDSKPLMFKGRHDMAAFLAQSPNPIYRPALAVVFP